MDGWTTVTNEHRLPDTPHHDHHHHYHQGTTTMTLWYHYGNGLSFKKGLSLAPEGDQLAERMLRSSGGLSLVPRGRPAGKRSRGGLSLMPEGDQLAEG